MINARQGASTLFQTKNKTWKLSEKKGRLWHSLRTAREEKAPGVLKSLSAQQTLTVGKLDSVVIPTTTTVLGRTVSPRSLQLTCCPSLLLCDFRDYDYSHPLLLVTHCKKFLLIDQSLREERQSKEALKRFLETSLAVQWLRLCSQCKGRVFDPWWGSKFPHMACNVAKKLREK